MMGGLHLKAHSLQGQAHIPPGAFSPVHRAQIKVSSVVVGCNSGPSFFIRMKQKKLRFRSGLQGVTHFLRFPDHALKRIPGTAFERSAVRSINITDQPGCSAFPGTPGINHKGIRIRIKYHVGFFDTYKAFNGGSVE